MNLFEKFLYMLQAEMETPKTLGWFHIFWILFVVVSIIGLFIIRKRHSEKQLKLILGIYGVIAFILELLKQLIWAFNYDSITNIVTWDYEWYSAPFQLCTTPIFISIICLFLKNNKLRKSLLSYMSFITILGSLVTLILPDSCFTSDILINIHTMWLHCGSLVVSIYLLMSKEVEINKKNFINSFIVFLVFVVLAEVLNVVIYNSGILNGETFNMFYISPYFTTHLPVFNIIQENVPFIIYLLSYILIILIGGLIVYFVSYAFSLIKEKE
ncbi:MAG: YwaF family protein [Bacilli bacterium]|nr:YwaF family protein [Bacilli bacterium]